MSVTVGRLPLRDVLVLAALVPLLTLQVLAQEGGAPAGAEGDEQVAAAGVEEPPPEDAQALARRMLNEATEDEGFLAIHAKTLLDAGDLESLRQVLDGGAPVSVLGVLLALEASVHEGLLSEVLVLAARADDAQVSRRAAQTLERLASERPEVVVELVDALNAGLLPETQLETILRTLGRSRNLGAVDALIEQLDGPRGPQAAVALDLLTGHDLGQDTGAWRTFWERHRTLARDEILEQALDKERRARRREVARMRSEVVQTRIMLMGQDVDRLVDGLADEYTEVRLEAVERLRRHPNVEQAASAVPQLLSSLGRGAPEPEALAQGASDEGGVIESDLEVRAAMVRALGVLGRGRSDVQEVLLDMLRTPEDALATAAVDAMARVRDEPAVVAPLLELLDRMEGDPEILVTVLQIIAANQPEGALDELTRWLDGSQPAPIRAAAVRAVMACGDLDGALDAVESFAAADQQREVRYALAVALGERGLNLALDHLARPRMLELLAGLLSDGDASVRAEAASSLGELGEMQGIVALQERSRAETDPTVMVRILDAVGDLGLAEGTTIIGRACASWVGADAAQLEEAGRRALESIGDGREATVWLSMAETLQEVAAWPLAEWTLREIPRRFEGASAERDVVARARGQLASVLWRAGEAARALNLLVELDEAAAPYPPRSVRLDLLARASESLGLYGEAADYYLARLAEMAEGDSTRNETEQGAWRTLLRSGRPQEARPLIERLLAQDGSDNELLFALARVQRDTGEQDLALDTLTRLVERIPTEAAQLRAEVVTALDDLRGPTGTPGGEGAGDGGEGAEAEPQGAEGDGAPR